MRNLFKRKRQYEVTTVDSIEVDDTISEHRDGIRFGYSDDIKPDEWVKVTDVYWYKDGGVRIDVEYRFKTKYTDRMKKADFECLPEWPVKRRLEVEDGQ